MPTSSETTPDPSEWVNQIHAGDALELLSEMPASSVNMCMTSPPYWGLRDYSVDGQIGLEDTLDEYVDTIVEVGRGIRRVLREDGGWWLNLGDTYSGGGGVSGKPSDHDDLHKDGEYPDDPPAKDTKFGRKNKLMIPHRVAIALQEDGWYVRNDVTWNKPNPLPESVDDRLATTTEQIFFLTQQPDYWFDLDAIREPHAESSIRRAAQNNTSQEPAAEPQRGNSEQTDQLAGEYSIHPEGKNPGDVFDVPVHAFPDAHFAVFPPELVVKPIKASCPPKVCESCGTPYERDIVRETLDTETIKEAYPDRADKVGADERCDDIRRCISGEEMRELAPEPENNGWEQACDCDTDGTEPGIVLDPFAGAGTTLLKARDLGRRFIGIDLNPEYCEMARKRLGMEIKNPDTLRTDGQAGIEKFADGVENQ